jgi:hypothetical protein
MIRGFLTTRLLAALATDLCAPLHQTLLRQLRGRETTAALALLNAHSVRATVIPSDPPAVATPRPRR